MRKPFSSFDSSFPPSSWSVDPEIAELLARRWNGQGSERDEQQIAAWVAGDVKRSELVALLQRAWSAAGGSGKPSLGIDVQDRVFRDIRHTPPAVRRFTAKIAAAGLAPRRSQRAFGVRQVGVFIAVTVMLIGGAVVTNRVIVPSISPVTTQRYATTAGQRARVTLPDSSVATLGPATALGVTMTRDKMLVRVDGQALFSVRPQSKKSFVVQTAASSTRVLGTTFLVRQYATDQVVRVVVVDGRVSIWSTQNETSTDSHAILAANTMGELSASGKIAVTPHIAAKDYTAWIDNVLVFRDASVKEVAEDLTRVYGIDIQVNDSSLAARRVTWKVQASRYALTQTLRELTLMLGAHVLESKGRIIIAPMPLATPRFTPGRSLLAPESRYGR